MKSEKIAVILRVFNRLEDLRINVRLIRERWQRFEYYLIVSSNGTPNGFPLPDEVCRQADLVVELAENAGHLQGNTQLLKAAVPHLPDDCSYTVILEADTWLMDDALIEKYVRQMQVSGCCWASSEWIEKHWTLGLDFAILRTDFTKDCFTQLFAFGEYPERWVADYMIMHGVKFQYIRELMPVHQPRLLKKFYETPDGRFRLFPAGRMVTHHIEDLPHGMADKLYYAGVAAGAPVFGTRTDLRLTLCRFLCQAILTLARYLPRSRWLRQKKHTYLHLMP